jgi:hypothetical protein
MSTAQAVTKTTPRRLPALALIAGLALAPVVVGSEQAAASSTPPDCFELKQGGFATPPAPATLEPTQDGGSGPYVIDTKPKLVWLSWATSEYNTAATGITRTVALAASYVQTEDIDLAEGGECNWLRVGNSEFFTGSYDGGGNDIENLRIVGSTNRQGMFDFTDGATLTGINFVNVSITSSKDDVGALAGQLRGGTTVTDVTVTGSVTGEDGVGGITGTLSGGSEIVNSHSQASVEGNTRVGGLAGALNGGDISTSSVSGNIAIKSTGSTARTGGLVGGMDRGEIANSSVFGNVTIEANGGRVGGLVGETENFGGTRTIRDSSVSGSVTIDAGGNEVGGLVGLADGFAFVRTSVEGTVTVSGGDNVGGLVGKAEGSAIEQSFSGAVVNATGTAGGLVGWSTSSSEIEYSYATGNVTSTGDYVGGLVGELQGPDSTISDSYSTGAVSGDDYVGGFVGNGDQTISRSYSIGAVTATGPNFGGFLGAGNATITNSFWDIQTSGQGTSAGGVGVLGKTSAEMKSLATYPQGDEGDWEIIAATGFSDPGLVGPQPIGSNEDWVVWGINAATNCGYPFLWWQTVSAHTCVTSTSGGGTSSSASVSPAIHMDVKAKTGDLVAGAPVLMEGQGLKPGSAYSLVVRSTPVTVKSGVVTSAGTFSHTVTLPAGIAPGNHTITLRATGSDGSALVLTQSFTVAANGTFSALGAVTGSTTGGLAVTGVNGPLGLGMMSLAALMVFVGAGLILARRRAECGVVLTT